MGKKKYCRQTNCDEHLSQKDNYCNNFQLKQSTWSKIYHSSAFFVICMIIIFTISFIIGWIIGKAI
jgi:hypothetical protein